VCTLKNALLASVIMFVIDIALNSHMLTQFFGLLLPGVPHVACGANGSSQSYFFFYFYQWTVIQVSSYACASYHFSLQIVTTSLGPASIMVVMVLDMFAKIRARKKAVAHRAPTQNPDHAAVRDKNLQNQMLFLMLSSIGIFFVTTLPLTIGHILSVHQDIATVDLGALLTFLTILNWLQSLNCAVSLLRMLRQDDSLFPFEVNFYVHCLSSALFRREFMQLIGIHGRGNQVTTVTTKHTKIAPRTQTLRY
jgi:hypothetical protein